MRSSLFCMFLITRSYGMKTFNLFNELLFRSPCENFYHATAMKSLNFREKTETSDSGEVPYKIKEQWKKLKLMQVKKLDRMKESEPKGRLEK